MFEDRLRKKTAISFYTTCCVCALTRLEVRGFKLVEKRSMEGPDEIPDTVSV